MIEWLRCSTRIYTTLSSNLSIIIRGMTLHKSLTAKLSRMTRSFRANTSKIVMLDGRSEDTVVSKRKRL